MLLAGQQAYMMKKVMSEMDSSTAYMVFDFKQKFLCKGFCEGSPPSQNPLARNFCSITFLP